MLLLNPTVALGSAGMSKSVAAGVHGRRVHCLGRRQVEGEIGPAMDLCCKPQDRPFFDLLRQQGSTP